MCTIAATGLNLWCFNTVVWATNGLSICEIILILFYQTVTKLQTFWIPNKFNASRKYKPSVLQNVHSIYTLSVDATCILENKNPSCCWDGPTVQLISEGQRPTSGCGKIAISQSDCSPIHDLVTLLYWTLKSVLE